VLFHKLLAMPHAAFRFWEKALLTICAVHAQAFEFLLILFPAISLRFTGKKVVSAVIPRPEGMVSHLFPRLMTLLRAWAYSNAVPLE
jgi:hypothetical protein